jgi:hypothetical protein
MPEEIGTPPPVDPVVPPVDPATPPTDPVVPPVTPPEPAKPIEYALTLPKDSTLDAAFLERTVAIARERGLSPEQAQATVDLVNQEAVSQRAALLTAYQPGGAEWTKQVDAWRAETLADVTLGKTPEERTASLAMGKSVLDRYTVANPAEAEGMKAFLDNSGLGDHPATMRFFKWLGEAAGEKPVVIGGDGGPSQADKLKQMYPSMTT